MCPNLFSAYLLVMSTTSSITCIPMENMQTCRQAINDFSVNFVETRRKKKPAEIKKTSGPGYTIVTPSKNKTIPQTKKTEFSLTCVRGKS